MNYQVLARKWRPQKFSEVIGQQHIVEALTNSFVLKKLHHAYILIGTRGIGKTTIARLIVKSLNCKKGITAVICGKCKNCKDIESGCFIDLIEIDAASRTKVEETREFLDNVQYMPSIGLFKTYIIDEAHMLSKHSFNALLKILEEPPTHIKFILITTEYKKIPETILSRCLQFYLKPLNIDQIATKLTYIFNQENILIEKLALDSLAYAAKGSMRDALNLSEQAIVLGNNKITSDVINNMFGIINIEHPLCLIENLINGNIHNILRKIDNYAIIGINWDYLLTEMLIIFQKIAINQFLSNSLIMQKNLSPTKSFNKRIYELSCRITPENVQLYYQIILLGRRELPYAPNHRMGVEITMLRALAFKPIIIDTNTTKHNNNEKHELSIVNKELNSNILKDSNISKKTPKNIDNNVYIKKIEYTDDCLLRLDLNNKKKDFVDIKKSHDLISMPTEENDISETTRQLLNARSTLSKYKKCNELNITQQNMSDSFVKTQKKITTNILERLSNINMNIINNNDIDKINIDCINLKKTKNIKDIKNIYQNNENITESTFIKEILQQAIKNDPWILQIYRLSLPKLAKTLIMNSWREEIDKNKICLHVRSKYYCLNSVVLQNIIQKSLSEYTNTSIILDIKKDDNTFIKTPIEYISILYKEKILQKKQEFSYDPYIKMLKNFFDIEYNEDDIKIL